MGSYPLPALDIRPPQSPLEQYGQLANLASLRQRQALMPGQLQAQQQQLVAGQQENQMRGLELQDAQSLRSIAPKYVTKDENGAPTGFDFKGFLNGAAAANVNPITLQKIQMGQLELTQKLAAADEATRNNEIAKNKLAYETVEGLRPITDPEKRTAYYQSALGKLHSAGVDVSQLPPQAPDNKQLDAFEGTLGMHSQVLADAKTQAEINKQALEEKEFAAKMPGGPLNPVEVKRQEAPIELQTAIAKETNPQIQAGKVQVAKAEGEARANIEAQMARGSNAALAQVPPHLVAPASADAAKAGTEFAQAQSVTQRLNAMMDAAKKGNVVSYQLIPQEGALQLTTSQGVHRINMAEIQNYGGGSLWQRMEGHIGKTLTGKSIPDSVLNDMADMQKIQQEGAQSKYENSLKTINQTYGSNFKPVDMPTTAKAVSQFTVGQKVTIKGQQKTITAVHPDGSFDAK